MAKRSSRRKTNDKGIPTTEAIEDYVKTIYSLQERGGGPVSTSALADRLDVAPASVSAMVKRLAEMKMVRHEPYRGVTLTESGERVSLKVIRHHRLLELYLHDQLGMSWDKVHQEAEVLEHHVSDDLEELIADKLGHPTIDPHGDPIPDADLTLPKDDTRVLADLEAGEAGTFTRVSDSDPAMLRYLAERKIMPGAELSVEDKQPFGGPLTVKIEGREHVLGGALAESMHVTADS